MKFKVGDKVRCVRENKPHTLVGNIYTVNRISDFRHIMILNDLGELSPEYISRFELVQENKLPHELLGLPRLWYIKVNKNDPLWDSFWKRYEEFYNYKWSSKWQYFGFDNHIEPGVNASDDEDYLKKRDAKLITLQERDRCVNKKRSQTKQLSKPIRSCEHNGSIYKEDTIDGVSIEEMKATRDNINSKLQTWRNLFFNPKK